MAATVQEAMRILLAVLVLLPLAVPAEAARKKRCDRRGLDVVVANEHVMVLSKPFHEDEDTRYFGCRRGTRRLEPIGEYFGFSDFGTQGFTLSRNWVAWFENVCDRRDGCGTLHVSALNLLTGRALSLETRGSVDWELTARGRLVVLDGGHPKSWELPAPGRVRVAGTTGEHLLATGDDLDQGSLTVTGDRAHWTRGGVAESAGIP